MAGIRDVAKEAGVGIGTVSRYLNKSGYVSEKSRLKIQDAIQKLDYQPNELARNLFHNRSGIIGVIVPDLEHPFFSKLSKYIEINLYEHGYKTMICNTVGISNREKEYLSMLERNIVDGIIVAAHTLHSEYYLKINKPILAMDKDFKGQIPLVHSDHKKGGRLAAEAIIQAGCKNVLQFSTAAKVITPSNQRHIEFKKICELNNIKVTTIETNWNHLSHQYFRNYMEDEMKKHPDIDAVFTADIPAIACMNVLKKTGKRIPEDVKIIGYDGLDEIYMTDPPLTSVKQNIEQLAECCVDTILKIIEGKDFEKLQVIDVELISGGSI